MRAAAREVTESVGLEPFGGKEKSTPDRTK